MRRNTDADNTIRADCFTDSGDDLGDKTEALFFRSTKLVIATVNVGAEELRQQQAVAGGHLDSVKARLRHALGGISMGLDHLPDIIRGHRPRHGVEAVVRNRRRRVWHRQQAAVAMGDAAAMCDLAKDPGAMSMNRLGDFAVTGNTPIRAGVDIG